MTRAEYQKVLEAYAPAVAVTPGRADPGHDARRHGTGAPVGVAHDGRRHRQAGRPVVGRRRGGRLFHAGHLHRRRCRTGRLTDAGHGDLTATPGIEVIAETRCVAGKVTLVAKATNRSSATVGVRIESAYGECEMTLAADATTSATFASRVATAPAGQVQAVVGGTSTSAAYAGRTC